MCVCVCVKDTRQTCSILDRSRNTNMGFSHSLDVFYLYQLRNVLQSCC